MKEVDPDMRTLTEWLGDAVNRNRVFVGSLAADAILLVLPRVWSTTMMTQNKRGIVSHTSIGLPALLLVGLLAVMYIVPGIGQVHRWGMRPPSDGERTVARWLIRTVAVLGLWATFFLVLRAII